MYTELMKRTSQDHVITVEPLQLVETTLGSSFKAVDEIIPSALVESLQFANPMNMT